MTVLALVLYVLWLAQGIALRAIIQHRRTGDTGLRGFGGQRGSAEWWSSLLLVGGHVGGVLGPAWALFGLPLLADVSGLRVAGLVVVLVGILVSLVSQLALGDSWRIGVQHSEQTSLVTGGPYSLVRNPIFSSVMLTVIGFVLMAPSVLSVALFAVLVLGVETQVRLIEEPNLRQVHGVAYRLYTARVGRFVPGLGRTRHVTSGESTTAHGTGIPSSGSTRSSRG
jgi:protein-S-isoprenylcysteine O-methyltransferase Ste14